MFAHHHIQRERLSVRARMGDILSTLEHSSFVEFVRLFRPEEGRMGITVTFVAILELVREGLIDIVQAEPFAPLHVRAAGPNRTLRVVADNDVPGAGGEQVFADEPALVVEAAAADEIPPVDEEPVSGGSVVKVDEFAGTDVPPSPGEETDE
jgi:segregation and condensation protein A